MQGARGMPEGCEGPEGPQGAEVWGVPRGAGGVGMLQGCRGPGSPVCRAPACCSAGTGCPVGSSLPGACLAGGFNTPAPWGAFPASPGQAGLWQDAVDGRISLVPCCVYSPAECSNPQAVFCAQNLLHFALFISALAKTLHLTLWGEPVTRVWSLQAAATLKPLPNAAPRWGYTNPWAVGCEVAVSPGLRQEWGIVTWL